MCSLPPQPNIRTHHFGLLKMILVCLLGGWISLTYPNALYADDAPLGQDFIFVGIDSGLTQSMIWGDYDGDGDESSWNARYRGWDAPVH